jgi:succinyl-CoA synthetase alpha subunit
VFDTYDEALAAVKPDASVICVPPPFCAEAVIDAIKAGIPLAVCTAMMLGPLSCSSDVYDVPNS